VVDDRTKITPSSSSPQNELRRERGKEDLDHLPSRCANSEVFGDTTSNATPVKVYLSAGTNQFRVVVSPKIKLTWVLMSSI